ncbi:50S ribosomal protein L24 [Candidatus Giovannonibacteria bacterium RIFCSPHIGHO2_02_FULL_46_20]|uniref:Large ribosomal subunit protein uL24 n=1 Tax=Candidatus Giovannonibacteria bacterium RIFCSPHIGHO2_02_FULL_46_20 TaxID=1798338 RepID=A0A1F5WFK4_9BACT|nr:MAG: 50S ribosomal protein L24 [Candidatus Giovannonibacteria bacterium RIFCSPHIGHO2_02_FULL_46_20]
MSIRIRKNDVVVVISGKDRGKRGRVIDVISQRNKVVIEGVALKKKHQRPKKSGQKGEIVTLPSPIDASNAMLYCSHCARGARVGFIVGAMGDKKVKRRICKKCKNDI